jgi:antitoxin component YwqK of YwqJK toxin-antitoxin module
MKQLLFSLLLLVGTSAALKAQYHYTEVGATGQLLVDGYYSADPKVLASDPKEVIAQKMALVHKVGTWKHYFEAGQLAVEEHYTTAGNPEGIWKQWYNDGKLSQEINYTSGTAVFYHANGAKAEAGSMKGFMRVGKWEGWHQNGKVNFTGSYDAAGNKDGDWYIYDADGKLMAKEIFSKGKLLRSEH